MRAIKFPRPHQKPIADNQRISLCLEMYGRELQIDRPTTRPGKQKRIGEERFVTTSGQVVEELESRILRRLFRKRHRLVCSATKP